MGFIGCEFRGIVVDFRRILRKLDGDLDVHWDFLDVPISRWILVSFDVVTLRSFGHEDALLSK